MIINTSIHSLFLHLFLGQESVYRKTRASWHWGQCPPLNTERFLSNRRERLRLAQIEIPAALQEKPLFAPERRF